MKTSKQLSIIGAGLVLIISIGLALWQHAVKTDTSESATSVATSTTQIVQLIPVSSTTPAKAGPFPINPADHISSWTFSGPYSGNTTLIAQANADIAHLTGLLGKGQYNDYDLYNGIANDETNLGNGTAAYQDYNHAIALYPATGLAYMNLGHLMALLGANQTAADAYAKAVVVEPQITFTLAQLRFLVHTFPSDTARITAAFAAATKQYGKDADIAAIKAEWTAATKQ